MPFYSDGGAPVTCGARTVFRAITNTPLQSALDATTGKEKWVYKTVRNDLWDFDVPMQPSLSISRPKRATNPPWWWGPKRVKSMYLSPDGSTLTGERGPGETG
ncbi:hypothetical protein ACPA9J_23685 [Pseudomonas aeruginosa]